MKSRLLPVVILSLIMLTLLSCAMVDRALNREAALPQDQVIGAEVTDEIPASRICAYRRAEEA